MGLSSLPEISNELISNGMRADTPAAAIHNGTTKKQVVIHGTLADLPEKTRQLRTPVLIIVGEVVSLADKLSWFEPDLDSDQTCEQLSYEAV